jgi:hypothetical protein
MYVSQFRRFSTWYDLAVPLDQNCNQVPFPPVPGVVKLSMKFTTTQNLDMIVNTHWRYTSAPPTAADLNVFLGNVATGFTNNLQPLVGTNITHVQDIATDLSAPTGFQAIQTHAQVGSRSGGVLPISAAALFNGKITRRYRGGKIRNYWPYGTDADLLNSQQWTPAALTAFNSGQATFNQYLATTPAGALTITGLVNVSYYQGHCPVLNPVTKRWRNIPHLGPAPEFPAVDTLTQYSCNPILGTQRRRLRPG